jgi:uncharacterized protein with NAD-binding domain and iron-sulfur cluster
MTQKKKIAILGAGPAGLSAAFGLSQTQELRDLHDITIYQVGWRAGGKCASGREGPQNRIAQNGTHYLFGSYDNTMSVFKQSYDALKEAGIDDFGDYKAALLPRDLLAFKHFFRGQWHTWALPLPVNTAAPGEDTGRLTPPAYLSMFLQSMLCLILGVRLGRWFRPASPFDQDRPIFLNALYTVFGPLISLIGWVLGAVFLALFRLTIDIIALFGDPDYLCIAKLLSGIRRLNTVLFGWLATRFWLSFKLYTIVDFACTIGIGLIRDLVPSKGLGAIEGKEFRGWIAEHGASRLTQYAPFVATWYDAVAAFEDGDPARPNLSAGVSMMAITTASMTYKGHFSYQMRAEAGDTLIAPIYECLRQRGVKFRFFHRVRDIVPGDGNTIDQIVVEQQVTLRSGDPESYDPFVMVDGLRAWPNAPLWDQINEPEPAAPVNLESFYTEWRGTTLSPLRRGVDFDEVILAMPVATFPTYCAKLIARSDEWRNMADTMTGVETQTIRLYFNTSLDEMGWTLPSPILSNYARPFATWEDNGHLVEVETWPEGTAPKAIATLFGPLEAPHVSPPATQSSYPDAQLKLTRAHTRRFLEEQVGALWPKAATLASPLSVDWTKLIDPQNGQGPARLEGQYIRANVGPLQRYTMARAGTAQHRLPADGSQYSNMVLAGDWTQNHYLIGSVEGAVMSGLQASRALSGFPQIIPGENTGL